MNNITVVGNLGQDPELSYTTQGKAKVRFSVGDTRVNGEKKETTWHRCVAWGEQAEHIAAAISKGQRVIVTGRYKSDEYTTKQGEKRNTLEILVDDCGPSYRFGLPKDDAPKFSKPSAPQSDTDEEPF